MTATRRTNPREERRLLQQELGRTQLLDAAEEIFGTKGFHETTLKEIADRADFSVGSVYSFFENKDDLYESVWLRRGAEFLAGFEEALSGSASGLDGIARIVTYEVEFLRARPSFADLYLRTTGSLVPVANEQTSDRIVENARHIPVGRRRSSSRVRPTGRCAAVILRLFPGCSPAWSSRSKPSIPMLADHPVRLSVWTRSSRSLRRHSVFVHEPPRNQSPTKG